MKSFIRKIFDKEIDEQVHKQFIRFGKGKYEKRAVLKLQKADRIKARGSFEFANDFVLLVCELASEVDVEGEIISRESIKELIGELGSEERKKEMFVYEIKGKIKSEKLREIVEKSYSSLLDITADGIILKMKKNLPKPGQGGNVKVDDKFCVLEAGLEFWLKIKEAFFWDIEGKRAEVLHDFLIDDLVMPKGEKDFALIRLKTKRKGKIIRHSIVDKQDKIFECEFEA